MDVNDADDGAGKIEHGATDETAGRRYYQFRKIHGGNLTDEVNVIKMFFSLITIRHDAPTTVSEEYRLLLK